MVPPLNSSLFLHVLHHVLFGKRFWATHFYIFRAQHNKGYVKKKNNTLDYILQCRLWLRSIFLQYTKREVTVEKIHNRSFYKLYSSNKYKIDNQNITLYRAYPVIFRNTASLESGSSECVGSSCT